MDKMDNFDFNNSNNMNEKHSPKFKGWGMFLVIFWAFFFAMALSNLLGPYFSQFLSGLISGVAPIVIAICIAFIFYRFVDFIEKVLLKNAFKNSPYKFAIKRTISISAVFAVLIGIVLLIFSILIPKIIEVVEKLTAGGGDGGVQIYNNVVNEICAIAQRWFGAEVSQESIKEVFGYIFDWFMQGVGALNNVLELSMSVLNGLLNTIMTVILTVLLLKDKEKISKFFRRFTYTHFKKEKADELCVMTGNANKILYNYFMTKIIEFFMIFITLGLAYVVLDLEFTWELSLLIGVFNFIPYFGIYIGSIPAVLITLIFNSVNAALYMAIATIVITTIEFNLVTPFITSKKLKVSSLVVIISILVGGAMFDIVGMLFAPPIAALLSVVVTGNIELKENHMKYVMELNEVREKRIMEQQTQLGIVPDSVDPSVTPAVVESNKDDSVNKKEDEEMVKKEPEVTSKKKTSKDLKKAKTTKKQPNKGSDKADNK